MRTTVSKVLRTMLLAFGDEEIAHDLATFLCENAGDDLGFRMQGTSV